MTVYWWSWLCAIGIHRYGKWGEPEPAVRVEDSANVSVQRATCGYCLAVKIRKVGT